MIWPDEIEIRTGAQTYVWISALKFEIVMEDEPWGFAVHPRVGGAVGLTITELSTGLAITTELDIRLLDFPEVLIPRCKDFLFDIRTKRGDAWLMDIIEVEVVRHAQALEFDDDIPF